MLKLLKRPGSPFWYVRGTTTDRVFTQVQKKKTKALLDGLGSRLKSGSPDQPAKNVTPLRSGNRPLST
jgi:hypothetical protein